jgi:predicted FMN-binding regulatory protein PaiB
LVYLPPAFTETREDALIAHIERHDFAVLVTRGAEARLSARSRSCSSAAMASCFCKAISRV